MKNKQMCKFYIDWAFSTCFGLLQEGEYDKMIDEVVEKVLAEVDCGVEYSFERNTLYISRVKIYVGGWHSCGWLWCAENYKFNNERLVCSLKNKVRLKQLKSQWYEELDKTKRKALTETINQLLGELK